MPRELRCSTLDGKFSTVSKNLKNLINQIIREDLDTISNQSFGDLQQIVDSHVVLTGASGFIGTWLTLSFLHARKAFGGNGTIVLSCRNAQGLVKTITEAGFTGGFEIVETDVRQFPEGIIQDRTLLIHAATPARASLSANNPLEMFDIIQQGQQRLLELCFKKDSVRFLFLSSGAVYGLQPLDQEALSETWAGSPNIQNPGNAYHEGKRVAELMGNIYSSASNMKFVAARLFAFLAPFLPLEEHFAVGNFLKNAVDGERILINSGGGSVRSYMYATDLCSGIWGLAVRGIDGEAYNIGSSREINLRELAKKIRDLVAPDLEIDIRGTDSPENVTRYIPDISKWRSLGSHANETSLEEAIIRTASWIRLANK
jgi:nucleoside-diphosphate-sugar epimerase